MGVNNSGGKSAEHVRDGQLRRLGFPTRIARTLEWVPDCETRDHGPFRLGVDLSLGQ